MKNSKLITLPVAAEGPRPDEKPTFRFWGKTLPPENAAILCRVDPRVTTDGTKATIRLYGPIDPWGGFWGVSSKEVAEALDALDDSVNEILLRINSPGGSCFEGLAILNLLRAWDGKVTAAVDGIAASAASFIAAGCDETVMSPGTTMMIHDPWSSAWGCNAEEMRKTASILDKIADSMASLYADAAGGKPADWRAVMQEETWYTAEEAVEAGLAQSVGVVADIGPTTTAGGDDTEDPAVEPDLAARFDLSAYTYAGREHAPAPKPPSASAVGSTTEGEGGSAMAFTPEQITDLRTKLGLADDADEATVTAAALERINQGEPKAEVTTPEIPEGMVLVESAVIEELKSGAADGRAAQQTLNEQARDTAISAAIAAGKTTPARRDHFAKLWDADPEGTKALLDSLEAGLVVPTIEAGHDNPVSENQAESDAVYGALFGDDEKKES